MPIDRASVQMEYKSLPILSKEIGEDRVVKSLFAVMGHVDSGRDRIQPRAFVKTIKEASDRIRVLWQHDFREPPIGVPALLKEIPPAEMPEEVMRRYPDATGALYGEVRYLDTPRGNEILTGIREGAIRENSIGYDPIKVKLTEENLDDAKITVRELEEVRLWDVSPVNWGMQAAAVNVKAAFKGAIPFKETPKAPEGDAWDGPAEVAKADMDDLMAMCAWCADKPADERTKGDCKLPHHRAGGDHAVVWKGVAAAMGALLGGRGGVDLPEGDRKAVYNHLAKHYAQFDKEPPDFKLVELAAASRAVLVPGALKAGRVLSARNLERLKEALQTLQEILAAAEPPDEDAKRHALTVMRRLQFAERDPILLSQ